MRDRIAIIDINTKNITIGDTNITISGTVSDNILDDIEELIEQKNREML